MVFLNLLQSLDLGLEELFLLHGDIGYLRLGPLRRALEYLGHASEGVRDVVVYSFDDGGDVLIEVIEVGDQLNKAEVDKRVPTGDDTGVDLLISGRSRQLGGEVTHDTIHSLIKLLS